ncbi:MAG: hypothetical protein U9R26_05735, partial [Campylobacterota bacterium]|nr:hypothetical protein [Campylobacterota bacterium]
MKVLKISMVMVLGSAVLFAGADQYKKYGVESGKIDYKITGSGNIMGVTTKTAGKKRVLFDTYGARELNEENQVQKTVIGGNAKVDKSHKLTYMNGAMIYTVDLKAKRIMRMQNPGFAMMSAMGGKDVMQTGEAMMEKMGGKKVGTDKVLGYTCDIWEIMGSVKQCMYKGIPLKIESNVMGIKNVEVATKAEFDISLSNDDFELPDFPIYDMQGNKLDKSKLESMDKKSEVQAAQAGEDMAALGASMAAAMQSAGVKKGERPTEAQEKKMEDAMMASMLPLMKQKFLAEEKMMLFAKECFSDADTLKEANTCNQKTNEMSGEQEEDYTEWNEKTKK